MIGPLLRIRCAWRVMSGPRPVAAEAIVHAASHPRRELWVGRSTVAVIVGSALAPRLADRHLARTSVDAQQTEQPLDPRPV